MDLTAAEEYIETLIIRNLCTKFLITVREREIIHIFNTLDNNKRTFVCEGIDKAIIKKVIVELLQSFI